MKPLDRHEVAHRVFWNWRDGDRSWDDVVARRDARVLRIVRRLTRRDGGATRQQIRDLAMTERGQFGYGNTQDTVQSLHRLIRRRLVIELRMRELYYIAGGDTCPTCGAPLE